MGTELQAKLNSLNATKDDISCKLEECQSTGERNLQEIKTSEMVALQEQLDVNETSTQAALDEKEVKVIQLQSELSNVSLRLAELSDWKTNAEDELKGLADQKSTSEELLSKSADEKVEYEATLQLKNEAIALLERDVKYKSEEILKLRAQFEKTSARSQEHIEDSRSLAMELEKHTVSVDVLYRDKESMAAALKELTEQLRAKEESHMVEVEGLGDRLNENKEVFSKKLREQKNMVDKVRRLLLICNPRWNRLKHC